jgi:hypothetical protein
VGKLSCAGLGVARLTVHLRSAGLVGVVVICIEQERFSVGNCTFDGWCEEADLGFDFPAGCFESLINGSIEEYFVECEQRVGFGLRLSQDIPA